LGLAVGLLGSTTRRAEIPVLISSPRGPSAVGPEIPDALALVKGSVLVGNVRSTLRLNESTTALRKRLSARLRHGTHVVVISATASDSAKAQQLAQEAGLVFTQLVKVRFATGTPPLRASLLDSAHDVGAGDRHLAHHALLGATAGLILGLLGAALLGSGAGRVVDAGGKRDDLREREQILEQRIRAVSERERNVARRAAARALAEREERPPVAPPVERDREVPGEPQGLPEPSPVVPEEEATVGGVTTPDRDAALNINDLEQFVHGQADAPPDRLEEWRTYLFYLRSHADTDGRLPSSFASLVANVFRSEDR
jgi:hypothetical protein